MHRLPTENRPISTRILWDDVNRKFIVTCADLEVHHIITRLARVMGVKANPDGSWMFPANAELGPDNFSEEARRRIEFGVSRDPHRDEPAPMVDQPKVQEKATIVGPERPHGVSATASREIALSPPVAQVPDPRDGPTAKPIKDSLKHLF